MMDPVHHNAVRSAASTCGNLMADIHRLVELHLLQADNANARLLADLEVLAHKLERMEDAN